MKLAQILECQLSQYETLQLWLFTNPFHKISLPSSLFSCTVSGAVSGVNQRKKRQIIFNMIKWVEGGGRRGGYAAEQHFT